MTQEELHKRQRLVGVARATAYLACAVDCLHAAQQLAASSLPAHHAATLATLEASIAAKKAAIKLEQALERVP